MPAYFSHNYISGVDPRTGLPVEINCTNCGSSVGYLPKLHIGMPSQYTSHSNMVSCSTCGEMAMAVDGTYEFEEKVFEILTSVNVTRQQRRRFLVKAKKAQTLENLELSASTINPALAEAVKSAKSEKDPWRAIRSIYSVLAFLTKFTIGTGAAFITADQAYKLYMSGEAFKVEQESESDDILVDPQERPEDDAEGEAPRENNSPSKSEQTDVTNT